MRPFQKVIKYGAIALAIYLAIMIISVIIFVITTLFGIGVGIETISNNINDNDLVSYTQEYSGIDSLNIDLGNHALEIKNGDTFKVELINVSKNLLVKQVNSGKELKIEDKTFRLFGDIDKESKVIIYIPNDLEFKDIKLDLGVSDTNIEEIKTSKLELDIGTGNCKINNIQVANAEIDSGAGNTTIENSSFGELEFNGGIGETNLNCEILNRGEIEAGVGNLRIDLIGSKDKYKLRAETGIGNLIIDGSEVKNGQIIGNGNINVNIEAGIGKTNINFVEETI